MKYLLGLSVLLALTAAGCASLLAGMETRGLRWTKLRESDFPAPVRAIVWKDGARWDAARGRRWGNWTVRFAGTTAVAEKTTLRGHLEIIAISRLTASNPVEGTRECEMRLEVVKSFSLEGDVGCRGWGDVPPGVYCSIQIKKGGDTQHCIAIACPVDLEIERTVASYPATVIWAAVKIQSAPRGANVYGADGEFLGETPVQPNEYLYVFFSKDRSCSAPITETRTITAKRSGFEDTEHTFPVHYRYCSKGEAGVDADEVLVVLQPR